MTPFLLRLFVLAAITVSLAFSSSPIAHASWVSKALGLDRHNDTTPTPVTVVQVVIPIVNPTPLPTVYPITSPSGIPASLPITGPLSSAMWPAIIAALLCWIGAVYKAQSQARQLMRKIHIV